MPILLTRTATERESRPTRCGSIITGIELVEVRRATAIVWTHDEPPAEVERARAYAKTEGYTVRVLADSPDLLERARALELA